MIIIFSTSYNHAQYPFKYFHIPDKVCNGIGHDYNDYFRGCCTTSNLCGINQGDCDSDDECSGNLVCGTNNCPSPFPSNADCCENPQPGNLLVHNDLLTSMAKGVPVLVQNSILISIF